MEVYCKSQNALGIGGSTEIGIFARFGGVVLVSGEYLAVSGVHPLADHESFFGTRKLDIHLRD
jgi:hypothetical protein